MFFILLMFSMQASASTLEDEHINELRALDWKQVPNSYSISGNTAKITTTENDFLVIGKDADEYMFITQGHKNYHPDAVMLRVRGPEVNSQVIYNINKIGYLTKDDWGENIDKDVMLKEIQRSTAEVNKLKGEGYLHLYVDGWAQEPHLDNVKDTVYWATSGHDSENNKFINAKALKLGREGYTEIFWIGSPEQFTSTEAVLEPVLKNYNYSEGFKYSDYVPGTDAVAAAGVGAVVYKLVTGKTAAKVGALAIAAVLAKKLWFLIFLPFIYAWKVMKRKFSKKPIE